MDLVELRVACLLRAAVVVARAGVLNSDGRWGRITPGWPSWWWGPLFARVTCILLVAKLNRLQRATTGGLTLGPLLSAGVDVCVVLA